jgi:hypothetical protein
LLQTLTFSSLSKPSQVVISSLQHSQNPLDWRISPIIYDIIGSILASISWSARKINRSANFCAYSVAHWAAVRSFSGLISTAPLPLSSVPIVSEKDSPPTSLLGL